VAVAVFPSRLKSALLSRRASNPGFVYVTCSAI
jgi:hypothetical protein